MNTSEYYEEAWSGAEYTDASRRWEADKAALEFLEPIGAMRIIDVGVGAGESAVALSQRGAHAIAVDLTMAALRRIQKIKQADHTEASPGKISLVCADAHQLPFRHAVFDKGSVFSVLMFLDLDRALPELKRVLKPNADVSIVEPISGNPFIALYRICRNKYGALARWRRLDELKVALLRHFSRVDCEPFYLMPAATLLRGRLRNRWMNFERQLFLLCPALTRFAWIIRISAKN